MNTLLIARQSIDRIFPAKCGAPFACLLLLASLATSTIYAQVDSVANDLAGREKAFSAESERIGTRDSFLRFFSEDCIGFYPAPQRARPFWEQHAPTRGVLTWYPTFVQVASSQDLGYSTGPWEYRMAKDSAAVAFGFFGSVWRKDSSGTWSVVLDLGGDYPRAEETPEVPQYSTLHHPDDMHRSEESHFLETERKYTDETSKNGAGPSLEKFGAARVRVYRDGEFPAIGKADAVHFLGAQPTPGKFEPRGSGLSKAGDLGYVYGIAISGVADSCSYLRVWKREEGWKLLVDILRAFNRK
jgi:ketosteroid isomerase-like protein